MEENKIFTYREKVIEARNSLCEANRLFQRVSDLIKDKLLESFPDLTVEGVEIIVSPYRSFIEVKISIKEGSDRESSLNVEMEGMLYKVSENLPDDKLHLIGLFVETVLRVFTDEREKK